MLHLFACPPFLRMLSSVYSSCFQRMNTHAMVFCILLALDEVVVLTPLSTYLNEGVVGWSSCLWEILIKTSYMQCIFLLCCGSFLSIHRCLFIIVEFFFLRVYASVWRLTCIHIYMREFIMQLFSNSWSTTKCDLGQAGFSTELTPTHSLCQGMVTCVNNCPQVLTVLSFVTLFLLVTIVTHQTSVIREVCGYVVHCTWHDTA